MMPSPREPSPDNPSAYRTGRFAALGGLVGLLLSGPLAVALVNATHPQPAWSDADLFATSYHTVQILPYAGGILLVFALIFLVSSIHATAGGAERTRTGAALIFTSAFAAFIFFNYVAQTTFVPALAQRYEPANAPIVAALSMSNPRSLAWGIEMWGWGLFGVATWLVSPVFDRSTLERTAGLAFAANGPMSIAGALWTVARPGWVMTPTGLVLFAAWNGLLAAMLALAFVAFGRRIRRSVAAPGSGGRAVECDPRGAMT
jgi:hypothetical protein